MKKSFLKKIALLNLLLLNSIFIACKDLPSNPPTTEEDVQVTEPIISNDTYEEESEISEDFQEEIKTNNTNCIFENDNEVLSYLIGKTFRSNDRNTEISFSPDGATVSGRLYQWLSYETLGGFKGYVKLSSTSMDNPDGVLKLWVSCRENAVTDGKVVLMYD